MPGISILNVAADVLHIFDLGLVHQVIGNVLWQLCYVPGYFTGATPEARLNKLWTRIRQHYHGEETSNQLGNLTLSMFVDTRAAYSRFPAFTTRVKAAESRSLIPGLRWIFQTVVRAHNLELPFRATTPRDQRSVRSDPANAKARTLGFLATVRRGAHGWLVLSRESAISDVRTPREHPKTAVRSVTAKWLSAITMRRSGLRKPLL